MILTEKYDKLIIGIISGLLLPLITAMVVFLFIKGDNTMNSFFDRIAAAGIETNVITLCVFPNVIVFLLFNHFDMLRASRGVLAVTIFWAVIVFGIKFIL
jgi:hypothetical protein